LPRKAADPSPTVASVVALVAEVVKIATPPDKYGRRPDLDAPCSRCQVVGRESIATAFRKAPVKNKKGRQVRPAETVHHCAWHQSEVSVTAA
jgi:hypothetical protein